VVFPRLDGAFGCVSATDVRGHVLESNVVFLECFFEIVRAFVVQDVQVGCVAI
jgi:hypothetical protein